MNRRQRGSEWQRWSRVNRATVGVSTLAAMSLLAACGTLFAPSPPAPHFYTLDRPAPMAMPAQQAAKSPQADSVLVVALPRAGAGFDTDRIVYMLDEHRLQPYADNQWIDTPPKMLAPLISGALDRTRAFGAVLPESSPVSGRWELQSDIVRLQHEVSAARFRFTLRVTLIEMRSRAVVFTHEFDGSAPVAAATPAAAVSAANVVVADVLAQMATACAAAVALRR